MKKNNQNISQPCEMGTKKNPVNHVKRVPEKNSQPYENGIRKKNSHACEKGTRKKPSKTCEKGTRKNVTTEGFKFITDYS